MTTKPRWLPVPVPASVLHDQEEHALRMMKQQHKRLVFAVEACGGRVVQPFGDDYYEIEDLDEAQFENMLQLLRE